jgi:hypothetical protein
MTCARVDVFVIEIYYWSRSTPTFVKRDWRKDPALPEVANTHGDPLALFGTEEEAEAEAVFFVAAHPKYLGHVRVKALLRGAHVSFRD